MPVTTAILTRLEPIAALSAGRLQELSEMCSIERVSQGLNPFRMNVVQSEQLLYLIEGELKLTYTNNRIEVRRGGTESVQLPVEVDKTTLKDAIAVTELQILRIDADLLDIMLTWDQLASFEKDRNLSQQERTAGDWMQSTDIFSAESLKNGIFRALPPENVEEMFRRMERLPVRAGQQVIRQGDEGDYYYLIESGIAAVTREAPTIIAELNAGAAFGEEALASGNKRNASVTMRTDGVLLRLGKSDFVELLQKPLLTQITIEAAKQLIQNGAQLLDVRTTEEFSLKHVPSAINLPLPDIRSAMQKLSKQKDYITYCQSGRRAAAAAFVLAQHGYRVMILLNT